MYKRQALKTLANASQFALGSRGQHLTQALTAGDQRAGVKGRETVTTGRLHPVHAVDGLFIYRHGFTGQQGFVNAQMARPP